MVEGEGFEPSKAEPSDLQSDVVDQLFIAERVGFRNVKVRGVETGKERGGLLLPCYAVPNSVQSSVVKKVVWHPKALIEVKGFPEEIRRELGYLIFRVQQGESLGLPASRPMPDVAAGVSEFRVRGPDGVYRAFYYLKVENRVLVFHAFKKKTQQTPSNEIDLGAKRLKELLNG